MFGASCELPSAYLHICYLRVLLLLVAVREVAALYVLWWGGAITRHHSQYHQHYQ